MSSCSDEPGRSAPPVFSVTLMAQDAHFDWMTISLGSDCQPLVLPSGSEVVFVEVYYLAARVAVDEWTTTRCRIPKVARSADSGTIGQVSFAISGMSNLSASPAKSA